MISAASNCFERGSAAMREGDIASALRWLEQAHSLAKSDGALTLMLATAGVPAGNGAAYKLCEDLAHLHDVREAWIGLAAARRSRGLPKDAAGAIRQVLSRHCLPA